MHQLLQPGRDRDRRRLSEAHQQLLAGVREVAFGRSLPMATRDLRMGCSQLGDRAGVIGAAIMVIEHVLAPRDGRPDDPRPS